MMIKTKVLTLRIQVKPNSKIQKIIDNKEFLTILLKSKPIQNRANRELIKLLKSKFKGALERIQITSGLKSSDKIIELVFLKDIHEKGVYDALFN